MNELPTGFYTQSRIFCFLPLPAETTLPLHINGCFMVENDRKSLVRFNKDNKTNDNSSWNDYMLGDVILSAYINLLSLIASRLTDKILDNIFPIPKDGF
jgi:sacsin